VDGLGLDLGASWLNDIANYLAGFFNSLTTMGELDIVGLLGVIFAIIVIVSAVTFIFKIMAEENRR